MSSMLSPTLRELSSSSADAVTTRLLNRRIASSPASPRDSLSPIDIQYQKDDVFASQSNDVETERNGEQRGRGRAREKRSMQDLTFPDSRQKQEPPVPAQAQAQARAQTAGSPRASLIFRPHRPIDVHIPTSNGLTTLPLTHLKKAIWDGHTAPCITRTQVLPFERGSLLKTPTLATTMGNRPSSIADSPAPDNDSLHEAVVRKPVRIMRKGSANLFKRVDSALPLPRPTTATTILITEHASRPLDQESPIYPFMDPKYMSRDSVVVSPQTHLSSIVTVKGDDDGEPLSASTTIRDSRPASSGSRFHEAYSDADGELEDLPNRMSALSPTIPAPSPLPEDSPHKYGLRDRMDTPELVQDPPADEADVNKARRRSTGPEIFNEAQTLQSAKSFLNNLSTSRRRAESTDRPAHRSSEWRHASQSRPNSRPSSRPVSMRPRSTARPQDIVDNDGRRRGHNFKPNGFAFARPMSVAQLQCFRQHDRLIGSRNALAPVECAVCHMDDDREHWSCAWCALRMCGYCRRRFEEGGMGALRERVKGAEVGGEVEDGGEEVGKVGRGRSAYLDSRVRVEFAGCGVRRLDV